MRRKKPHTPNQIYTYTCEPASLKVLNTFPPLPSPHQMHIQSVSWSPQPSEEPISHLVGWQKFSIKLCWREQPPPPPYPAPAASRKRPKASWKASLLLSWKLLGLEPLGARALPTPLPQCSFPCTLIPFSASVHPLPPPPNSGLHHCVPQTEALRGNAKKQLL